MPWKFKEHKGIRHVLESGKFKRKFLRGSETMDLSRWLDAHWLRQTTWGLQNVNKQISGEGVGWTRSNLPFSTCSGSFAAPDFVRKLCLSSCCSSVNPSNSQTHTVKPSEWQVISFLVQN